MSFFLTSTLIYAKYILMPVCYNFAIWLISSTLGDSFGGERKRFRMRTTRIIVLLASCLLVLLSHTAWSGPVYTIEFINGSEKESGVQTFQDQIRDEINALMKSRGKIQYQTRLVPVFPPEKSVDAIAALTKDTAVDCFISVGFDITDRVAPAGELSKACYCRRRCGPQAPGNSKNS